MNERQDFRPNHEEMLDRLNEGCKIVGFDWRYLYLNDAACRHARRKRDELLGKTIMEIFPGIEDTEIFRKLSECMDGRYASSMGTRLVYPDGSASFFHLDFHPVSAGMLIVSNDVNERKLAEEALLESEERYRRLFEAETDAILLIDQETCRLLDANPATLELYGYTLDELIRLNTDDISAEPAETRQAIAMRQNRNAYRLHRKKDGTIFPVEIAAAQYAYRGREVHVAAMRDISERVGMDMTMQARLRLLEFAATHTLDELLQKALDEVEKFTGSSIGFFHFVETDQKEICLQAWSSRTLSGICTLEGKGSHCDISEAGVWLDAIKERRPVIHNDYLSLPHRRGLPPGHVEVFRELIVPIIRNGIIVAILGVGNKPTDYHDHDVESVTLLADLAWGIVARKQAEEALRASEERYHRLFDLVTDGIYLVDIETGSFIDANTSALKLYGFSREEFLLLKITDISLEPAKTIETLSSRQIHIPLRMHRKKDGTAIAVEITASYSQFHGRQVLVSAVRDITERKRVEEELIRSEEKYRAIAEFTYDWETWIGPDGECIYVSPSCERICGYPPEEFIKDPGLFSEIVHTDDREVVLSHEEEVLSGHHSLNQIEFRIVTRGGDERWIEHFCQSVFTSDGRWLGQRTSNRDITERKRLEEEAKLSQAKLIQANKMASLGLLASSIAHEINNPNNFILNNATMLRESWQSAIPILDEYYLENGEFKLGDLTFSEFRDIAPLLFSGMVDGAQRISIIVDKLKKFVSQENDTNNDFFDLNQVLFDSVDIINSEIRKRCENFRIEAGQNLPQAVGNPQQIGQVIINLLLNAMQSLPDRNRCILVNSDVAGDGEHLFITIKDEGSGISPEVMERLSEPFFTTRRERGGTGLGLYITESILRENRGRLSFDSEHGKGTTATVQLKICRQTRTEGG
jgi:PAS domain S-box-containing protein